MTDRRLIVCGSAPRRRTGAPGWTDRALLRRVLDDLARPGLVVVQGGADGADRLAFDWAMDRGYRCEEFLPEWSTLGRGAGPVRNRRMIEAGADQVVAFSTSWPPTAGTAGMLALAAEFSVGAICVTPDGVVRGPF